MSTDGHSLPSFRCSCLRKYKENCSFTNDAGNIRHFVQDKFTGRHTFLVPLCCVDWDVMISWFDVYRIICRVLALLWYTLSFSNLAEKKCGINRVSEVATGLWDQSLFEELPMHRPWFVLRTASSAVLLKPTITFVLLKHRPELFTNVFNASEVTFQSKHLPPWESLIALTSQV